MTNSDDNDDAMRNMARIGFTELTTVIVKPDDVR